MLIERTILSSQLTDKRQQLVENLVQLIFGLFIFIKTDVQACKQFLSSPFNAKKTNLTKPRKLLNPELYNEAGMTTQMKALNEYFLMVVFTLLLNRVHVFAIFTRLFLSPN